MCIEFHLQVHPGQDERRFEDIQVTWTDARPTRGWDTPIRPTDQAFMIRAGEGGLKATCRRWWLTPAFHKGPLSAWKTLCANVDLAVMDTSPIFRDSYATRRALVPLTSFIAYEEPEGWRKGQAKRRWEVRWAPQDRADKVRYFAAIWDTAHPSDSPDPIESFAIVTRPAGSDLAPLQASEPVVLTLAQGLDWLRLDGPGKAGLAIPSPAGDYSLTEQPLDLVMSREMRRAL